MAAIKARAIGILVAKLSVEANMLLGYPQAQGLPFEQLRVRRCPA